MAHMQRIRKMKKISIFLVLCLLLGAVSVTMAQDGMMTEIGAGEGEVSIVSWAGYVERGETDPAYDWVTSFEAETGCKVSNKIAATSDEMVALMNEGNFDLVTA